MMWSHAILPVMPFVDHLVRLLGRISLEVFDVNWIFPSATTRIPVLKACYDDMEFFPGQPGRGVPGGEPTP